MDPSVLFVKLAGLPIANPPTPSHPLAVKPALGNISKPQTMESPLWHGLTTGVSDFGNRAGRLASGIGQTAVGAAGTLLGAPSRIHAELFNSATQAVPQLSQPGHAQALASGNLAGARDFHRSTWNSMGAGLQDVGSAFSANPTPSAGRANMENNAKWLDDNGRPGMASMTRSTYNLGDGVAQEIPAAAALGGVGRLTTMPAVAGQSAVMGAAKGAVPFVANTTAMMRGTDAIMPEAGKQMQYGLDQAGLGGVARNTSQMVGNAVQSVNGMTGGVGGSLLAGLAPYAPGLPAPLRAAMQAGQMSPFFQQPAETINPTTGQTEPTFQQPEEAPPTIDSVGAQPELQTPQAPQTPQETPQTAPQAQQPPESDPAHPLTMFSNLADTWGKMSPQMQMAMLAGGGLGLVGLTGNHSLTPLMGLALAGLAAHHGMLGGHAQNLVQGFGKTVSDSLFKPGDGQPGGSGSKSEATPATPVEPAAPGLSTIALRTAQGLPMQQKTDLLLHQIKQDPELKMKLREIPQNPWVKTLNNAIGNPALQQFQQKFPGANQQDFDSFNDVYNNVRQQYPDQVQHNIPAQSLDAVDTIRNNVNINGNIPASNQA
jgi:hypothetical protein